MDLRGVRKKFLYIIGEDRERYIRARGMNPRLDRERIGYLELKADLREIQSSENINRRHGEYGLE